MRFSASEIVEQMADTYATSATFRDTGRVTNDLIYESPKPHNSTTTYPFSLWMARPDLFRLDLDKEDSRPGPGNCEEVILRCAGRTRAWSARSATTEEPASLDGALACRGGAVNLAIPGLLLPDIVTGRDIAGLIHPRIETQEFIDGHSCYRIAGKERTESVTLWIDVHTFLLRRLLKVDTRILPIMTRMIIEAQEERIARARETNPGAVEAMRAEIEPWRDATGRVETTVYYHPERDVPIAREVFEIAGSA